MKKLFLILPLISFVNVSQAQLEPTDLACAQVLTFAITPEGTCSEFPTSCIPEDHKQVSSCDTDTGTSVGTSLEERLRNRFHGKKRLRIGPAVTKEAVSGKFKRFGRLNPSRAFSDNTSAKQSQEDNGLDRRSTSKDFSSPFRRHNVKGGFNRGDRVAQQGHRDARDRPQQIGRSFARREGSFSEKPKWEVSQRSHFSERRIGQTNPFNIKSVRAAQIRAAREARGDAKLDIDAIRISKSRRWRPGRLEGNLSGDPDFIREQAEKRARVQENLFNEE